MDLQLARQYEPLLGAALHDKMLDSTTLPVFVVWSSWRFGHFRHKTAREPHALQGNPDIIQGLQDTVTGMQAGGKRRSLIPPAAGYKAGPDLQPALPTFATQRQLLTHAAEPLIFEVQLLRVRQGQ